MKEKWIDIEGYEGYYQISNRSRVKSLARERYKAKHGKGGWLKERVLKQSVNSDGYLNVVLTKKGTRKHYKVHRLVAEYFIPNKDNKPEVNHIDGNKLNNSINNLEWVTRSENIRHAYDNDLNPVRLSISKNELAHLIQKGMYTSDIARFFGCSDTTIRNRARKYGLTIPTPPPKTKYGVNESIIKHRLKYQSAREITEELGCSMDLVRYYKNKPKEESAI